MEETIQLYARTHLAFAGTDDTFRLFSNLSGEITGKRAWIHVLTTGTWKGYRAKSESEGDSFTLTTEIFDQMIKNFRDQKTPPPIYYDHQVGPAGGKIIELRRKGEDLWALHEFTPTATQLVKGGEYFGVSAGFKLNHIDAKTRKNVGPKILEISLTNSPFIDGLTPFKLSNSICAESQVKNTGEFLTMADAKNSEKEDIKLDDQPDDKEKQLESSPKEEEKVEANEDAPSDSEDAMLAMDVMSMLRDATGIEDAAAIAAAIRDRLEEFASLVSSEADKDGSKAEFSAKPKKDDETITLSQRVQQDQAKYLSARAAEISQKEQEQAHADAAARVDSLIKGTSEDGIKLSENERETWTEFALSNRTQFERMISERPPIIQLGRQFSEKNSPKSRGDLSGLSDEELVESFQLSSLSPRQTQRWNALKGLTTLSRANKIRKTLEVQ